MTSKWIYSTSIVVHNRLYLSNFEKLGIRVSRASKIYSYLFILSQISNFQIFLKRFKILKNGTNFCCFVCWKRVIFPFKWIIENKSAQCARSFIEKIFTFILKYLKPYSLYGIGFIPYYTVRLAYTRRTVRHGHQNGSKTL